MEQLSNRIDDRRQRLNDGLLDFVPDTTPEVVVQVADGWLEHTVAAREGCRLNRVDGPVLHHILDTVTLVDGLLVRGNRLHRERSTNSINHEIGFHRTIEETYTLMIRRVQEKLNDL